MKKLVALLVLVACAFSFAIAEEVWLPQRPEVKKPIAGELELIDPIAIAQRTEFEQYDWKFGLINYASDFQSSIDIAQGIKDYAANYGIEVVEVTVDMDVSKKPSAVETLLMQEVDFIIDASWIGTDASIIAALEEGVPTLTYDTIFNEELSWFIGGDNATSGYTIGKYMGDIINGQWGGAYDYLVLFSSFGTSEAMTLRMESAFKGFEEKGIAIDPDKVVYYDTQGQAIKAQQYAADFLTAHPEATKILFGGNNGDAGVGMLAAVQTAGREADVIIYTYGAEQAAIDNMRGEPNCWVADVGYYFKQYGAMGVDTAIRILNGEVVSTYVTPEMFVINHENVDSYLGA
ncbi:MAG: sugar ABC transporter substrate-binding protein [Clostridiales bacterium]|nr:sugar ABC transporter substrate-binding protein [Clostridiales bacterium]